MNATRMKACDRLIADLYRLGIVRISAAHLESLGLVRPDQGEQFVADLLELDKLRTLPEVERKNSTLGDDSYDVVQSDGDVIPQKDVNRPITKSLGARYTRKPG